MRIIAPKDVPPGFDAADCLAWGEEKTREWLKACAEDFEPEPDTEPTILGVTGDNAENIGQNPSVVGDSQPNPDQSQNGDDQPNNVTPMPEPAPAPQPKPRPTLRAVGGNTQLAPAADPDADLPEPLSDSGIADTWIDRHGDNWRFVADWSSRDQAVWMEYTSQGWEKNVTNGHWHLVELECLKAVTKYGQALTADGRRKMTGAGKYSSVATVIKNRPTIACTSALWDQDKLLLGIPGGYVDLRDGSLHERDRSKLISMRTCVVPKPGPHPLADITIGRASGGDPEKLAYLWRWLGYILTGSTQEERFLYLHGPGGSGKGSLVNMIADILGDYAEPIKMDALVQSKHQQHAHSIAKLQGKRFAYASEATGSSRIDEEKIKWLTGGDKITANLMRQNEVSWYPHFKLLVYGNEIPQFSGSEGMERRFDLIEYAGALTRDERDQTFKQRMREEYPAVLHTMIQSCIEWQKIGLGMPASVAEDSTEFIVSQDAVALWIEQRTKRVPDARTKTSDAYANFEAWCERTRTRRLYPGVFTQRMRSKGWNIKKSGVNHFEDMELIANEYDMPPEDRW